MAAQRSDLSRNLPRKRSRASGPDLVRFSILCRPGHTADSLSLVVTDRTSPTAPGLVLTGDTLFRGGVGGADADSEASKAWLAAQLYESLFHRLLTLPDQIQIFPARSAGTLRQLRSGRPPSRPLG
jgi:glyoxylase-like metal-dependent hydrolase (beta-lactamase superfamily II)